MTVALGHAPCYNSRRMMVAEDVSRAQVERILQSETFRSAEVLRHLLRFLADKSIEGEADQLKEYSIGLDALGKPPTYDPRHDAIVRIQVGRLRQKLADYYRTEGKEDPVAIDLPKGHFKLIWEPRSSPAVVSVDRGVEAPANDTARYWRWTAAWLTAALLGCAAWGLYSSLELRRAREANEVSALWTPELEQLWRPFITPDRPLVLAFDDPIFVQFIGASGIEGHFRPTGISQWDEAVSSPAVSAIRKSLGARELRPSFNYVSRGDLVSSFLLGKLLGSRQLSFSVARITQVSWQDFSDRNLLLVGPPRALDDKLLGLPLKPELMVTPAGIRNLHPRTGEPEIFKDDLTPATNGEVFALVSNLPGPVGSTSVRSFSSNKFWGITGAVQSFTDPAFARTLVEQLRNSSGTLPRYYQVVLKVKYRDGVTTDVSHVMHRELPSTEHAAPTGH